MVPEISLDQLKVFVCLGDKRGFLEVSEKEKGKQEKKWWVFFSGRCRFFEGISDKRCAST